MSGLLDDAARRLAGGRSSRREFVVAGGALGAVAALGPLAGRARAASADDYCLAPCVKAAENALSAAADQLRAAFLRDPKGSLQWLTLKDYLYLRASQYADYYDARAACKSPNCGDKTKYPPPPPPLPTCSSPCSAGASCQPCPTSPGGGICCLDIFPLVNGKSQCCPA